MKFFEALVGGLVIGLGAFALFFLLSLIGAIPLLYLWDWVGVSVLGLKVITYWQAWGLMFLSSILFKSHTSAKS